ncbi:hypothetical protein Btru_068516 [Bulinus truncatus]|nr:hypothetical protein Btru_068516 [Bulinus truncatus]
MKQKAEQCKDDGNKCIKEGKHTEAIFHYTEAIRHEPNSAVLYSNRALAFLKIDQLYLALEDAQKAIKLEPSWPKGFYRKGEIEFRGGLYNKALVSYRQALILDPTDKGISDAISKTNKEIAKDRKDAPSIQYSILQAFIVLGCGGVGFTISKVYRYLMLRQQESLLEEPVDLLKEMDCSTEASQKHSASVPYDKTTNLKKRKS